MGALTKRRAVLAAVLGLAVGPARADLIIDTTPSWDGRTSQGPFGVPNSATYGQTITVPTGPDTVLNDFTFSIEGPSTLTFKGYVYAWDGARSEATGSSLFTSPTTSLAGTGGFEAITFNTGGLPLSAGSQYVLFASVSEVFGSSSGAGSLGLTPGENAYGGGQFVFQNNGGDPGQWTSVPWSSFGGPDLAFRAVLSPLALSTPEPPTLVPAGMGALAGLGYWLGRRRRAAA